MIKIRSKALSLLFIIVFIVACVWLLNGKGMQIEDTNGPDDFSLNTITDENIIHMDLGASGYSEEKNFLSDAVTYSSDDFSGVVQLYSATHFSSTISVTVNHTQVTAGNFRLMLLVDDEIVHEFTLNELTQTFLLEDVTGTVSLRFAGESAAFMFDYDIQ